jgi:hypothetical protein
LISGCNDYENRCYRDCLKPQIQMLDDPAGS